MGRLFFLFFSTLIILIFIITSVFCKTSEKEVDDVLNAAENVFKMMEKKDFNGIWQGLSEKSKQRIVDDVYKEAVKISKKENKPLSYTKEMILNDFKNNGQVSRQYWSAFLENFDPKTALEQSAWKIGKIERNYAEIILQHKKSERPAVLKMYKENSLWKLGLVESFWASKR